MNICTDLLPEPSLASIVQQLPCQRLPQVDPIPLSPGRGAGGVGSFLRHSLYNGRALLEEDRPPQASGASPGRRVFSPGFFFWRHHPVGIRSWFGGGAKQQAEKGKEQEYTIDDLIVLERYDEAADRLKTRMKINPQDLHSHLKLAEVYAGLRQFDKAVDEFGFVADEYAQDGFHDKGIALLSKAQKLAPLDQSIRFKIERIQRDKSMEHVRS